MAFCVVNPLVTFSLQFRLAPPSPSPVSYRSCNGCRFPSLSLSSLTDSKQLILGPFTSIVSDPDSVRSVDPYPDPVPEIIDPVFAKTSQNARFLLSENERFVWACFRENWVYKFRHGRAKMTNENRKNKEISCFEVLDFVFWGLKASSVAWTSFIEA